MGGSRRSWGTIADDRPLGDLVSDPQLSYLSGLSRLETLDLHTTQVGDLGLAALEHLTGLKELDLSQTTFPTPDWRSWLD